MTAASKKLRLAQPTLSAQLKQFESDIGKVLFERKLRQLVLNETGKLIFDYADTIFKKGQEMVKALDKVGSRNVLPVNVGVVATMPRKVVHNILKIPVKVSDYHLQMMVGGFSEMLLLLKNHQLEFVLSDKLPSSDEKGLNTNLLESVPVVFVAAPEFKSLRRKFPSSLSGQNLFVPSIHHDMRPALDQYLRQNTVEPVIKGEIQDIELLRVIAASGNGVVCVMRSAVSDLIKNKTLYVIGDNIGVQASFYIITADRQERSPVVEKILQIYA